MVSLPDKSIEINALKRTSRYSVDFAETALSRRYVSTFLKPKPGEGVDALYPRGFVATSDRVRPRPMSFMSSGATESPAQ